MTPTQDPAPATLDPPRTMRIGFDLDDPDDHRWVRGWRAEGANEDTVACCAVTRIHDRVIRRNQPLGRHVLVTSFQKSASTFLCDVLVRATGFKLHLLHATGRDNERNAEIQRLPLFLIRDTVSQEHMRATIPNIDLLRRMGVRPVVLVRNIFDALVSLRDHWLGEEPVSPIAHVPAGYATWSGEAQLWFVVRLATPWYLNFHASWMERGNQVKALWVGYDEVVSQTADAVARITEHSALQIQRADIDRAISAVELSKVRFNRGISGRGCAVLSAPQQQAVRDIAAAFNGACDFAGIGL
jgi:hypothetical protein